MNIDRCWAVIKSEICNVNEQRFDDFDLILRCLMIISDDIVDEYKQSRDFHKRKDSKFKFWTYVPSIERGSLSGARCLKEDQRVTGRLQRGHQKAEEDDLVHNSATDTVEFTDAERAAFRKKHGLGPRRYS